MLFLGMKLYFAKNMKFLREQRKLSQEMLAGAVGISRVKLAALELGNTKSPQAEDLVHISRFFKYTIDALLTVDLSSLTQYQLRQLSVQDEEYVSGKNLRVLTISVDDENQENVEYVPVKAKMGYAGGGFADPTFIRELPKYKLPNLPQGGSYRVFPGEGDSMQPIPDGSDITGRFVQDWRDLKPKTPCVVILKGQQDFVFKMLTFYGEMDSEILLESLNPEFEAYTVSANDVLEIWEFHSYTSRQFPGNGPEFYQKEVKQLVSDLYKKVVEG